MSTPAAAVAYDLSFQISPIILVDGIAANVPFGLLPIIALGGQAAAALQGAISGGVNTDAFFARYVPVPGSTLVNQSIATYPFASQSVAANATIQNPLNISLRMICPVKDTAGYLTKLPILTSLQNSLVAHNAAGGRYHVATPAYLYTNMLLTAMTDVTGGGTKQQMIEYQLDFVQPLVTQTQATSALNSLMSKLNSGAPVSAPTVAGTSFWSSPLTAISSIGNSLTNLMPGTSFVFDPATGKQFVP
jgi:hypothetical protein